MSLLTTAGGGANQLSTGYDISNSIRFDANSSSYLSFTTGTPTSQKIATWSFWMKKAADATQVIFGSSGDYLEIYNESDGEIWFYMSDGNSDYLKSTALLGDYSAWYHVTVNLDTTQSTEANRAKIFINGTQLTNFISNNYPSQNDDLSGLAASKNFHIGARAYGGAASYLDGYIAEFNFIDGTSYAPTYFAETNDNGVWVPKKPTGISYGNNGFFLEFKQTGTSANASGMGADTSGNGNHFGVNNLASDHITTDTPTNNFAVMNLLTAGADEPEMREGNLQQYAHGSSNNASIASTIMPDKGKWYVELFLESPSGGDYPFFGITDQRNLNQQNANGTKMAAGFEIDGATNNQSNTFLGSITNTNTGWPTFADNDIVQFALDLDNRKLWLGRNGTYINSGNPASGSNEQLAWTLSTNVSVVMSGYDGGGGGGAQSKWNFGNPPFSISSGNADANGYGNFEYAVPSGYYSLCTKNLAEYG